MVAELIENVLDRVTLKNVVLELIQHPAFRPVPSHGQRIRASRSI
jgi:hypothetical protein